MSGICLASVRAFASYCFYRMRSAVKILSPLNIITSVFETTAIMLDVAILRIIKEEIHSIHCRSWIVRGEEQPWLYSGSTPQFAEFLVTRTSTLTPCKVHLRGL